MLGTNSKSLQKGKQSNREIMLPWQERKEIEEDQNEDDEDYDEDEEEEE